MPRPYGLVGNEGSYKGIGSVPGFDSYNQAVATFGGGDENSSASLPYMDYVNTFAGSASSGGSAVNPASSVSAWISQNSTMLVIGTVVGLLLFRKS